MRFFSSKSNCLSIFILSIGIATAFSAFAHKHSDGEFPAAAIPAELLEDADVVIRLDLKTFTVESPGKAIERTKRVVTILNIDGREYGAIAIYYDQFRKRKSLSGRLLDANGKEIRKLKKQDVRDESAISGFSLYDDNRRQIAELYYDAFPYTVVFEYEVEHNGLISWPSWYPQWAIEPVEQSIHEVSVPVEMPVRYYPRGIDIEPQIRKTGGRKIYRWQAEMLPLREIEPHGPTWSAQAASVLIAPAAFEIVGYVGDMSNWSAFGEWYHALSEKCTMLPEAVSSEVKNLNETITDPLEITRRLYAYLQSNTHYISVQLGIGGWQPFCPEYVFKNGYGDCKALSNYMIAMLKAAGIQAYPTLIHNGTDAPDVPAAFPHNPFNHVIVCVPAEKDTLWLECTSQTVSFGHIGAGNEDRNVLVVTPEGGKLLRTLRSNATDNMQVRGAVVTLNPAGDGHAKVQTRYSGNQQNRIRGVLAHSSPRDRELWLRERLGVPSFRLINADFSDLENKHNEVTLSTELELPRYASRSNTRLFLNPNLMEQRESIPPEVENRTQPVDLHYAYLDIDSVTYHLPEGFVVEAPFPAAVIETDFGSYKSRAIFNNGTLEYIRRLEIRVNRLPAEKYDDYRDFIAGIVKADRAKMVFVQQD